MAQDKFKTYQVLLMALKRGGVKNVGATATLLLECFVNNHGDLKASLVESRGLCETGKFKVWRDELITKGWLNYTIGNYSRHSPGTKLLKYVNKEKILSHEMATVSDVVHVDKKVERLEERLSLLEATVKHVIETYDPPVTEAKIERHLNLVKAKNGHKS